MLALTLATTIHIGVLGSSHPTQLEIRPSRNSVLSVELPDRTEVVHEPDSVHLDFQQLETPAHITGPNGSFTKFVICLPNGVEKEYYGRLEVRRHYYFLQMVVEMDREYAVAAVLAAEGANVLPKEALRAQAVVARSYMLAIGGRHEGFDLCDTTHCQLLANPPSPLSEAVKAAVDTRGQVLTYRNKIVPAMYSQNCGGRTKAFGSSMNGIGAHDYPFPSVECSRSGHASGHGIGLCQLGAMQMAIKGATAEQILGHYFPGTVLALPNGARHPLMTVPTSLKEQDIRDIEKTRMQSRVSPGGTLNEDTDGHGVSSMLGKFVPPGLRALVHAVMS